MFDRNNYNCVPTDFDISNYINNHTWECFTKYMCDVFNIKPCYEFSKCSCEYGWNIKFKKGSKNLCTVYPRENYFIVLIVIGSKEKVEFENYYDNFGNDIKELYRTTAEGNGQKWLMIELEDEDRRYADTLKLIAIRSGKKEVNL